MELGGNQRTVRTRVDPDRQLVDVLRRGEPAAVEHLVATYGDRAYRLAARITRSEQDAEEVVQDAFWTVARKIGAFRGEAAFGSWFYRIVANGALGKLRGRARRHTEISLDDVLPCFDDRDRHSHFPANWSPNVEDPAHRVDLQAALTAALDGLPETYRAVVQLRDVEGRSVQEVSRITGLSITSVKTRMHRAWLVLRKRLEETTRRRRGCADVPSASDDVLTAQSAPR